MAEDRGCALSDLKVEDLKTIHPLFEQDVEQVRQIAPAVLSGSIVG